MRRWRPQPRGSCLDRDEAGVGRACEASAAELVAPSSPLGSDSASAISLALSLSFAYAFGLSSRDAVTCVDKYVAAWYIYEARECRCLFCTDLPAFSLLFTMMRCATVRWQITLLQCGLLASLHWYTWLGEPECCYTTMTCFVVAGSARRDRDDLMSIVALFWDLTLTAPLCLGRHRVDHFLFCIHCP